ncbi:MAG: ankyrin repeat domain-containing protein [Dehalococcoidia bacterium]
MSVAAIFEAVRENDAERVARLVREEPALSRARNEDGLSVVLLARYTRKMEALASLLAAGGTLDVFEAAAVGDGERLRVLLNSDPDLVNAYAPDGFFPLGLAAFFNHPEAVRLLLDRGADVSAVARNAMQIQALHAAVADKSEDDALALATLLLEYGAPVNAAQHGGYTPLHAAAQSGSVVLAGLLLNHGADRNARLDDGRTPAQIAEEHGHLALAARLSGGST